MMAKKSMIQIHNFKSSSLLLTIQPREQPQQLFSEETSSEMIRFEE